MINSKICTKCQRDLPFDRFYRDKKVKSGLRAICKECAVNGTVSWQRTSKGKAAQKKYFQTSKGKEALRKYRLKEKGKTIHKRYRQSDKGKATKARTAHKRRMNEEMVLSNLTAEEWNDIKKQYKNRCVYCGERKPLNRDHIIPVAKGGSFTKENIIPSCRSCSSRKSDKPVLLQLLVT